MKTIETDIEKISKRLEEEGCRILTEEELRLKVNGGRSESNMVRRNILRNLLSSTLLVFCSVFVSAGESSVPEEKFARSVLADMKNFHIPFVMDSNTNIPCISVSVGGTPLNMGIAVFSENFNEDSEIYLSGINKLGENDSVYEWARHRAAFLYNKPYELVTEADLSNVMFSGNIYFTLNDTCIEKKMMGNITANYFNLQEEYPLLKAIDGQIGLFLFTDCDNIVIDYRNNEIIVNAPPLPTKGTPMHQFYDFYAVRTKVKINGVEQDAIIAPAMSAVYLRDENKSFKTYTDEEIVEYGKTGTPRTPSNKYKNVVVQIDDVEVPCKGYLSRPRKGAMDGE